MNLPEATMDLFTFYNFLPGFSRKNGLKRPAVISILRIDRYRSPYKSPIRGKWGPSPKTSSHSFFMVLSYIFTITFPYGFLFASCMVAMVTSCMVAMVTSCMVAMVTSCMVAEQNIKLFTSNYHLKKREIGLAKKHKNLRMRFFPDKWCQLHNLLF